jgi:hypothetical protein
MYEYQYIHPSTTTATTLCTPETSITPPQLEKEPVLYERSFMWHYLFNHLPKYGRLVVKHPEYT